MTNIESCLKKIKKCSNSNYKGPVFIEILGTPNSGKTTAIKTFEKILKRNNIKYKVVYEFADKCRIKNKLSSEFNIWTLNATINKLLEIFDKKYSIVICERGLLDSICWFNLYLRNNKIDNKEYENILSYILLDDFLKFRQCSFILKCNEEISIKRENLDDLIEIKGSIVNEKILSEYNKSLELTKTQYANCFSEIVEVDTSELSQLEINKSLVNGVFAYISKKLS